jgi:hypothetical protein
MVSNMSQAHHTSRLEQALTDEEVKALLAAELNQQAKPAEQPAVSQPGKQKLPYGYGENTDDEIADMIDAAIFGNFSERF